MSRADHPLARPGAQPGPLEPPLRVLPDDGGSACPIVTYSHADGAGEAHIEERGLSARDVFAARALPALILLHSNGGRCDLRICARLAVLAADELLKALAAPSSEPLPDLPPQEEAPPW